jgi:hypothetical protein
MRLLSQKLVSLEYRDQLQRDLARAVVCRFLVGYVSAEGLKTIGRHLLVRALRDDRSFGVSSLTCACGYTPLLNLQDELGDGCVRLRYFMDPLVEGSDEPNEITLFHSKLVYLLLEREQKSVVYIGSHNWSGRAIGPSGPRNAEASLRFEMDFAPEHLEGAAGSIPGEINRHLLDAYNLPACRPAIRANETLFEQWYQKGCRSATSTRVDPATIILAVHKSGGTAIAPDEWQSLVGRGIYMQAIEEDEGQRVWRGGNPILVLVWDSVSDLQTARQPKLLFCRETTHKAGPTSALRGTNRSPAPIAGFGAVIFDEQQLSAMQGSRPAERSSVAIWSKRPVEIYDFEFPIVRTDSSQVDAGVTPKYQFHLEVERVIFPADGARPNVPDSLWTRESFAVAKSKESAKCEPIPGYHVSPELEAQIMQCLTETLFVNPQKAKVLPASFFDQAKIGKRASLHPLHETYIGPREKEKRDDFYARAEPGMLVADLDAAEIAEDGRRRQKRLIEEPEPLERIQRVYTTPLNQLQAIWEKVAAHARGPDRGSQ